MKALHILEFPLYRCSFKRRSSQWTYAGSCGNGEERAQKRQRALFSPTSSPSCPQVSRAQKGDQLSIARNPELGEPAQAKIVAKPPLAPTLYPYTRRSFKVVPPSQSNQGASQAIPPDCIRLAGIARQGQWVIPDSQEISGPSVFGARSSHDIEKQLSGPPPAPQGLSENLPQASIFGTQIEANSSIITATSPAASLQQRYPQSRVSQKADNQSSNTTTRISSPSDSQAAQIMPPLSSHPPEATSQCQFDILGFKRDIAVPKAPSYDIQGQIDFRESSQALTNLDGNIRTSIVNSAQRARPVTADEMNATSPAATPLSAKERLRLFREERFSKLSTTNSTSPAASSPLP
ncbi:hypothetical protein F5B18DRAFT_636457 [Nemania serpens]|nr:hypothetical protein F5B18DRAFT_636457 [Nemania serpens]